MIFVSVIWAFTLINWLNRRNRFQITATTSDAEIDAQIEKVLRGHAVPDLAQQQLKALLTQYRNKLRDG